MKKQIALIILDGWGYREDTADNAVAEAKTPVFDALWARYPHTLLEASGEAVGLPEGQIGNSEVGHTTIGAGKPMDTDLVRINKSIRTGEFANNPELVRLFEHVAKNNSTLHILGLISDGGVHSHMDHTVAVLKAAVACGLQKIVIHPFSDGRDTAPQSGASYLESLEKSLEEVGVGVIGSVSGRYYAMDRDHNWDRLAKVEDLLFRGIADRVETRKASEALRAVYVNGERDEYLEPIVFEYGGKRHTIQQHDGVFMTNFRPDRGRMITKKLLEYGADKDIMTVTMTQYDPTIDVRSLYSPAQIETTLAAEISKVGLTQQHVAETDKYSHATYFLNGGREKPHDGEEHVMLASRKDVKTHDEAPEMRAEGIADEAIKRIENGVDFTFINFANPDIVGHTGNHAAIVSAVQAVDTQLGRVVDALQNRGGLVFVTADHGNAEFTYDREAGNKHTSHTLNKVPAFITGSDQPLAHEGTLSDIAPTILELFGLPKPSSMTGNSLLR